MNQTRRARPTRNQIRQRGRRRARAAARRWLRSRELETRARHRVEPPTSKDRPAKVRIKDPGDPLPYAVRFGHYREQRPNLTARQRRRLAKKQRWQEAQS